MIDKFNGILKTESEKQHNKVSYYIIKCSQLPWHFQVILFTTIVMLNTMLLWYGLYFIDVGNRLIGCIIFIVGSNVLTSTILVVVYKIPS